METQEILDTLTTVLSTKEARKEGLHIKRIVEEAQAQSIFLANEPSEVVKEELKTVLDSHSKKGGIFDRVKNSKTKKLKPGYYKLRRKEKAEPLPAPVKVSATQNVIVPNSNPSKFHNNFFGKAGEFAVMSELLFLDYNVNSMTVDNGIDIIANKENSFYFIQVKTVTLQPNHTAHAKIPQKNFNRFINDQIRYVIVIKCDRDLKYFTLDNKAIQLLHYHRAISMGKNGDLSIKIRYNQADGRPYFYDEKEMEATFWEGIDKIEPQPINASVIQTSSNG